MAYTGPFPHNNAGSISAIVVSGTSFTGNVGNTGKIAPGLTGGTGIRVEKDSTINGAISNAGTIDVVGDGIAITGSTSAHDNSYVIKGISNGPAGTITASSSGIVVDFETRFAGGIGNAGAISADANGIEVIGVSTFAGGIENTGTIDGESGVFAVGISDFIGGVSNAGTIDATANGIALVEITTFTGNISNKGTITALGAYGIFLASVANGSGGTFAGSIGNSGAISADEYGIEIQNVGLSHFSGAISNSGRITATTNDGIFISEIAEDGNFVGTIGNSGPVASTSGQGVAITNVASAGTATFSGSILNSGAISAKKTGLDIVNIGNSRFSGTISNSAAIASASGSGVNIENIAAHGRYAGTLANSGAISARAVGLDVEFDGLYGFVGNVTNSGAVTANGNIGIIFAEIAFGGTFAGAIVNKGAVSAKRTALYIIAVGGLNFSGSIANSGAITSKSDDGILLSNIADGTFAGSISNSGAISSDDYGLGIENVGFSRFSGSISNSGRITAASNDGIFISEIAEDGNFVGTIGNSGAVTSTSDQGVVITKVASAGTATFSGSILNSGAISAKKTGLDIVNIGNPHFSGTISNSGAVTTSGFTAVKIDNIAANGTFVGNIINSGALSARTIGLFVSDVGSSSFAGGITNSGKIVTAAYGIQITKVSADGRFNGSIVNTGSIIAGIGMQISDVAQTWSGGITNSGLVDAGVGMEIFSNIDGNIVNAANGTIVSRTGITLGSGTVSGSIIDEGAIAAADTSIYVGNGNEITAAKTAIEITGTTLTGAVFDAGVITGKIGIEVTAAHGVNVFDDGAITGSGGTAVALKAAGDQFTLVTGYHPISGAVVGVAGDALQLSGDSVAFFDLNAVGSTASAQYRGFTSFNLVSGTWKVTGTGGDWNVDSGAVMQILSGTVLSNTNVRAGGTALVDTGGIFETTRSAAVIIAGDVTNSGIMLASGAGSILDITENATVSGGGFVEIDNGLVRIQGTASEEDVDFLSGGSGGLQIDNHQGGYFDEYYGTISGFGTNNEQYIDLRSVTFTSSGAFTDSFAGGTLTVSSGGVVVAEINLAGAYTATDFRFTSGPGDTVKITDPPAGTVTSGAVTPLVCNVPLLGSYMASLFASVEGQVSTQVTAETAHSVAALASPHTG